ncbi:dihydrofolate reductase family protein [uncultured Shewanella sp.]|uniref:dihydrofolate reductase family protein n=1 Tax=uncultured Shewanella sp. TaxID=173975 RepID=UPI002622571C|nr:dihydrofolate reductase family protein [uncultured Shewanella sp.]
MKCSVFIATSTDGYIAKLDGNVDWLHTTGNIEAEMADEQDMGFYDFIASVDCMVMGRKSMEMISKMNLSPENWPYGSIRIIVLSRSVTQPPKNLFDKVEMFAGDIVPLMHQLSLEGYHHAYIDGGVTITAFLKAKLINEMIITQAPILLGKGVPLFGEMSQAITLKKAKVKAFPNDFIQVSYQVEYKIEGVN